jgi:hypothetical protein
MIMRIWHFYGHTRMITNDLGGGSGCLGDFA